MRHPLARAALSPRVPRRRDLLTAHLGVVPDDLTSHVVDASVADPELLEAVLDERELATFTRLRDAGFQFYFSPGWAREGL